MEPAALVQATFLGTLCSGNAMTADALVAPWSANMLDEKRIARVVGLALGSVFLASLCLNALTW